MQIITKSVKDRKFFSITDPFTLSDFADDFFKEQNRVVKARESPTGSVYHYADGSFDVEIPFNFELPTEIFPYLDNQVYFTSYHHFKIKWCTSNVIINFTGMVSFLDIKMYGVRTLDGQIKKINKLIDKFLAEDLTKKLNRKWIALCIIAAIDKYNCTTESIIAREEYNIFYEGQTVVQEKIAIARQNLSNYREQIEKLKELCSIQTQIIRDSTVGTIDEFFSKRKDLFSFSDNFNNRYSSLDIVAVVEDQYTYRSDVTKALISELSE